MLLVDQCTFTYQNHKGIQNISFEVPSGTMMAIMGESGCGKSTLLQALYGLHDLDSGRIFWKDKAILGPKFNLIPGMPFMKYLAQDFDLMPFITVAENVGKYLSNIHKEHKQERIAELLALVEMTEYAATKAKFLSGGQMQRVALARVLALEPEVLLFDEPFSHIDYFRKSSLRRKLFGYLKQKGITTVIATHDRNDVLSFADTVLVLKNGAMHTFGNPKELYHLPTDVYTASLFGDVNEILIGGSTQLAYPHQLKVAPQGAIPATVVQSYYQGTTYLIEAQWGDQYLFFEHTTFLASETKVRLQLLIPGGN